MLRYIAALLAISAAAPAGAQQIVEFEWIDDSGWVVLWVETTVDVKCEAIYGNERYAGYAAAARVMRETQVQIKVPSGWPQKQVKFECTPRVPLDAQPNGAQESDDQDQDGEG
jgi:hypothetical protein